MNLTEQGHRTLLGRLTDNFTHVIVSGKIPVGAKISEPELANRDSVNRGPLREAIRLLEEREYFKDERDLDFHFRIVRGSENEKLVNLLCGELYQLVRMYRYRSSRIELKPQKALAQHRQILNRTATRDKELAEKLMQQHIAIAQKNIALQLAKNKGSNAIIDEKKND